MGTGTSTFRICFVRTQKSWSDFFRQSQQLVLVVQLDTTKKDVMDALQSGQLKTILTLLLILSPAMEVTRGAAKITIFKLFLHCSGIC